MKRRTLSILIGIWVMVFLFSVFPAGGEERMLSDSVKRVQSERDIGSDRSPLLGSEGRDDVLEFEAGTRQRTTPPEREAEALRFHQNTVLERFQNADVHGQLFLTFSADGIDLRLRSITGAEAPVADVIAPAEE